MLYYRLIHKQHASTPLGYGFAPGRWNLAGVPMIYACSHSSLNFLELLSIKGAVVAKSEWLLISMKLPDEISRLEVKELPNDWNQRPYPKSTQYFGTEWSQQFIGACLKIPSCRIPLTSYPNEHNLMLNPLHPDFRGMVKNVKSEDVTFAVNAWK